MCIRDRLVAIHLQDMWFPSVQGGEVEMTFVSPSAEVSQEMEEVQPTSVVPVSYTHLDVYKRQQKSRAPGQAG